MIEKNKLKEKEKAATNKKYGDFFIFLLSLSKILILLFSKEWVHLWKENL